MDVNESFRKEQANASFGKFRSAEELLNAYRNLESEFTKKCQLLKQLTEDNAAAPKVASVEFRDKTKEKFEQAFQGAAAFAEEIETEMENNAQFELDDLMVQAAYGRALHGVFKKPSELIHDEVFLSEYVYGDPTIKEKIVDDYLENLPHTSAPDVVKNDGALIMVPPRKPNSLSEAGELTKKLLNDRRI